MDSPNKIIQGSIATADLLTRDYGGRAVPECAEVDCEYMNSAGACALPVCKYNWEGPPLGLARWAIGRMASEAMQFGARLTAVMATLGMTERRVRYARKKYDDVGIGWILDAPKKVGNSPTRWSIQTLAGKCSRCNGTLIRTDDTVQCSMCSRTVPGSGLAASVRGKQ